MDAGRCQGWDVLSAIGLGRVEEAVYRGLLAGKPEEPAALARRSGTDREAAEEALNRLEKDGLVVRVAGDPDRFTAAAPTVALPALVARRRRELQRAELAATALTEEYRAGTARSAADFGELMRGPEEVTRCAEWLVASAEHAVHTLLSSRSGRSEEVLSPHVDQQIDSGQAERRLVVGRGLLRGPVADRGRSGRLNQARVAEWDSCDLLVVDHRRALLSLGPGPDSREGRGSEESPDGPHGSDAEEGADWEETALLVHAGPLVALLDELFERIWRQATPIAAAPPTTAAPYREPSRHSGPRTGRAVPDRTDARMLRLLLRGLTDAAVARHLDVGVRTVQRRVRYLMDTAGVTTRLQLGWHAHERGWVS